jgi:hypothetical protein
MAMWRVTVLVLLSGCFDSGPTIVERSELFRSPDEGVLAVKIVRSSMSSAIGSQEESMVLRVRGVSITVVPFGFFRIQSVEWKTVSGGHHLALGLTRLAECDEGTLVKRVGGVMVDYTITDYPK